MSAAKLKKSAFFKLVALGLCLLMGGVDPAAAALTTPGLEPAPSSLSPKNPGAEGRSFAAAFPYLTLPREMGSIESIHTEENAAGYVLHIQDLHVNEEAQLQVARILDHLAEHYSVRLIQLEGATGEIVHQPLSLYPNARARDLAARSFLREGWLNGAEYLAVSRRPELILYGVEDASLYEENRKVLLKTDRMRAADQAWLLPLRKKVDALASQVYSQPMRQWLAHQRLFRRDRRSLTDYLYYVTKVCPPGEAGCSGPQMQRLLQIESIQKQLQPELLLSEFRQALDHSHRPSLLTGNPAVTKELLLEAQKNMPWPQAEFRKLAALLTAERPEERTPQIILYLKMLALERQIDTGLFDEISTAENVLVKKLAADSDAARLYRLDQVTEVYEKAFSLSLTRTDAEFLYANRHAFEASRLRQEIQSLLEKYGFDPDTADIPLEKLEDSLALYESFYDFALRRDEKLIENALAGMKRYGQNITVLVTGGFHTPAIERRLRREGLNFCTILPAISKTINTVRDDRIYHRAMKAGVSPLTRLLEKTADSADVRLQLQIPSRLPTLADFEALGSEPLPNLKELTTRFPRLDPVLYMMIVLAAAGHHLNPAEDLEAQTPVPGLSEAEKTLASLAYTPFQSDDTLQRVDKQGRGRRLFPFDQAAGFAAEVQWQPLLAGAPEPETSVRGDTITVSLPEHSVLRIRLLRSRTLYETSRRSYRRSALAGGRQELRAKPALPRNLSEMTDRHFLLWAEQHPEEAAGLPEALGRLTSLAREERETIPSPSSEPPGKMSDESFLIWAEAHPDALASRPELLDRLAALSGKLSRANPPEAAAAAPVFQVRPKSKPSFWFPVLLIDLPVLIVGLLTGGFEGLPLTGLAAAAMIRTGFTLGLLLHEWFHLFAAGAAGEKPFTLKNILGNASLSDWFRGMLPLQPLLISASVITARSSGKSWVRHAGWMGSFFYAGALLSLIAFAPALPQVPLAVLTALAPGALYTAAQGLLTDILFPPAEPEIYCCGNQGVMARKKSGDRGALPRRLERFLFHMGRVTKVRGEQAAGRAVHSRRGILRKRIVNPKRKDLSEELEKGSRRAMRLPRLLGARPESETYLAIEHYRYGTSSAPAVEETHPHQWIPERKVPLWSLVNGVPELHRRLLGHVITHNGDFDDWFLFGQDDSYQRIGLWLEYVLNTENTTKGDSPKIAGMIDLLHTQGSWEASARLAWQFAVAGSLEEAFDGQPPVLPSPHNPRPKQPRNTAPKPAEINRWAKVLESAFQSQLAAIAETGLSDLSEIPAGIRQTLEQKALEGLRRDPSFRGRSEKVEAFVREAVKAFLDNSLNETVKLFMSRARGSFGLVVSSSTEPEHVILAARGQPMSVGFHPEEELIAYASESAALKVPIDEKNNHIPYRLDMDQINGEIMDLSLDGIHLYSESLKREISEEELAYSGRIIDMIGNPLITPLPVKQHKDAVADDLSDVPGVLFHIRDDWKHASGFNRQAADEFIRLLAENAVPGTQQENGIADLVVTGIETSQWLAEQFANDLNTLFPGLRIAAISSNKILAGAKSGRLPHIGPKTVVLALSQSGQTFPTLHGSIMLQETIPGRVFVMTGERETLMGAAVGQHYYKGAPSNHRVFTNGSGRRPAEPVTVAAAAAHQTLTELLLYAAHRLPAVTPRADPFGRRYTSEDIQTLETLRDHTIDQSLPSIVGSTARGEKIKSAEHRALVKNGKIWGAHVLEPAVTWGLSALYIAVSVVFGVPLLGTLFSMLTSVVPEVPAEMAYAVKGLDALLYIFFPFVLSMLLRAATGRRLFARLGKRTLVIGDISYVHQMLEAFVSKLFSMSYGIASIDVHGAHPQDHMLHRFGHRIVRGTLILLGRPNGLQPGHEEEESWTLMTAKQAKGVRNWQVGPEVVTIGHNPEINPNAQDRSVTLGAPLRNGNPPHAKLYETRLASFERLIASYVLLHSMAKKVSSFWPIHYDMSRTQSGTRVATTAAPVSASVVTQFIKEHSLAREPERILNEPVSLPFKILAPKTEPASAQNSETLEKTAPEPLNRASAALLTALLWRQRELLVQLQKIHSSAGMLSKTLPELLQWRTQILDGLRLKGLPAPDLKTLERRLEEAESDLRLALFSAAPEAGGETPRNELREAPAGLGEALQAKTDMKDKLWLRQEFDFSPALERFHALGLDPREALTHLYRGFSSGVQAAGAHSSGGEVILSFRAGLHSGDFPAALVRLAAFRPEISRIFILRDGETTEDAWKTFKQELRAVPGFPAQRIRFGDDLGVTSLTALAEARRKINGLSPESLIQILSPGKIKLQEVVHYEASLLGAMPLGRETVVILGSQESVQGARHYRFGEALEMALRFYERIAAAA